mgnify:CR=1 FL=1
MIHQLPDRFAWRADLKPGEVLLAVENVSLSFGGVKASGYGREGSRHGLDDYLDHKYVMTTHAPARGGSAAR